MILSTRTVLVLPSRLEEVLSRDQGLHGEVLASIADFTPWLVDNKLPFFPDFTDHGVDHVSSVLIAAVSLIRDESWAALTPRDAAAIIVSTLLHDIAMHLSEDGFVRLIGSCSPLHSEAPWADLWLAFLSEASRFDEKKLLAIFGDGSAARRPPMDPLDFTKRDRLLIGEFLRRHHARLAHEIALTGVPGPADETPLSLRVRDEALRHLFGLIARSHGMELRDALERLPEDSRRQMANVHVPFVMAVLRIADYLQVHSERAPGQVLRVRSLRSPISQAEWRTHHSIREIHCTHDDPEAIYVAALPPSGAAFARVQRLLRGIQYELDASWAVLGESYGRFGSLAELGLTLRRVRSNIDNLAAFKDEVPYYPIVASFETATASLLKLLIRPLYGDAPEVGVRELMQNAVDAVRERFDLEDIAPEPVNVSLDRVDGALWLVVKDAGVGMTVDVVKDYFLRAGASFRWSDAWLRDHTIEGRSRVLRSGRFGVGALAAFLIGDRIDVMTRNLRETDGVAFSAAIDDEVIELRRIQCSIGTTVRVRLRADVNEKLLSAKTWDWYCLDEPAVQRSRLGQPVRQRLHWPSCYDPLPPSWRRVTSHEFDDIQWKCWDGYDSSSPKLACNGIRVRPSTPYRSKFLQRASKTELAINRPDVSLFDSAGAFPLNLQRTDITTRGYPFDDLLVDSIARDFVAWMVVNAPEHPNEAFEKAMPTYPCISDRPDLNSAHIWKWFWTAPGGWVLSDKWNVGRLAPREIVLLQSRRNRPFGQDCVGLDSVDFARDFVVPTELLANSIRDANNWLRFAMGYATPSMGPFQEISAQGRRIVLTTAWVREIERGTSIRRNLFHGADTREHGWYWDVRSGRLPSKLRDVSTIIASKPTSYTGFAELFDCKVPSSGPGTAIAKAWLELLGGPVLPYARADRASLVGLGRVADLIAAHEALRNRAVADDKGVPLVIADVPEWVGD